MAGGRSRKGRGRAERRRRAPAGRGRDGSRAEDRGLARALAGIPGWVAPLVFALLTLALFREFVLRDVMLFGSDTLALGYVARAFYADALGATGFPLWNPVILGGTPFLESLAGGDSLHPVSVALLLLTETYRALGWKLVVHVFLAGCFTYAWLRVVGSSRGAALLGGTAFLLAPHFVTLVFPGHDGKMFVVAMTPILFWSGEWFLRRGGLLPLASLSAAVALVILSTHFQMAWFLFGAMGAYMLFRCVAIGAGRGGGSPDRRGAEGGPALPPAAARRFAAGRFGAFLLFSVLGAGVAAVQLVPAVDYVTEHSRRAATTLEAEGPAAVAYSSSWSLHPEEVVGLAVPEFVGSDAGTEEWTAGTYWGRNPFKYNHEYLGLVVLLLAALAFLRPGRAGEGRGARSDVPRSDADGLPGAATPGGVPGLRWFMLGLGLLVLLFTLGAHTPVWRIFYEVVPGISLFRAPSMAIFLTGFAAVTLAALGIDRGARGLDGEGGKGVVRVLAGGAGLLGVAWVLAASGALGSIWVSVVHAGIEPERLEVLRGAEPYIARGFGIAFALALLLALLWWGARHRWIPAALVVPALGVLVVADEWRVSDAFVEVLDYRNFAAADANIRYLADRLDEDPPFRLFSMVRQGQDVRPGMHGIELAGGHHPNDLWRYRELIGMTGSDVPEHLATFNPNVLGILNVRYILWPEAQLGPLEGVDPVSRTTLPDGRVAEALYEIPTLPRARVVGEAIVLPEGETLERILDPEAFDPTRETVLDAEPPVAPGGSDVRGEVRWLAREPDRLVFEVQASGPAVVVVAENWLPGWRAEVDGRDAPVLRADHTLRAVSVPEGTHRVEMRYAPPILRGSLLVSVLSLLVVAAAVGGDLVLRRRGEARDAGGPASGGEQGTAERDG